MKDNLKFFFKRLSQKLWFKPLLFCLLSIAAALIAHQADRIFINGIDLEVKKSSLEDLLDTMSASMLVIAIFAVGSMVSAYAAGSGAATPRSFKLIVADDVSQSALSVFIGAFIFSIVASIALSNGYYGEVGIFTLFILTLAVFVLVILVFLRWVDRISKLGRLGHTIRTVEEATEKMFLERKKAPLMGGAPIVSRKDQGTAVFGDAIGYVQHINMSLLQEWAEKQELILVINCMPGSFMSPDKPLLHVIDAGHQALEIDKEKINKAFIIDASRSFYNDPRFGLIALSEIASRALSPAVNDPGTAIAILGSHVRLFTLWAGKKDSTDSLEVTYDRIEVPEVSVADLFQDAFRPIARDGASNIEVMLRLQKALSAIAYVGSPEVKKLTKACSLDAYQRATLEIKYKEDLDELKKECVFAVL